MDELLVQADELPLLEGCALLLHQIHLRLETLEALLGPAQLHLVLVEPLLEPVRGAAGGVVAALELLVEIGVGDRVGDARGLARVFGR